MLVIDNQTPCQTCGKAIEQRGTPRVQKYCCQACRQRAYRSRQAQPEHATQGTDLAAQARIAELEQEAEQRQQRIAELEQELTRSRDLTALLRTQVPQLDRAKLEGQFMALGEKLGYRALLLLGVLGGVRYWQDFMARADTETLLKAIAAAEAFYEALTAPRAEQQAKRIADLEAQVSHLREQGEKATSTPVKKQKPAPLEPLPHGFVSLRTFCDEHGVGRNEGERLWKSGAIAGQKISQGRRVVLALGDKGRRDVWVQCHEQEGFRACDACPHTSHSVT